MSYEPKNWQDGERITTGAMNNIESGIQEALNINNQYEKIANKTSNINVSSTNTQYPTARAVYNLFNIMDATNRRY